MADSCCARTGVRIYACSGGSNVGQLTNEAAKALDGLRQGSMSCAIGVGAGIASFVNDANRPTTVALDGCDVACVRHAFERAGRAPDVHIVVTRLGVEKSHTFDLSDDQIALVAGAAAEAIEAAAATSAEQVG
ncbi:MAG TPA: putative zinc-binding protein [Armatimonadota bacterium]|nr:putative zinc-binding protein [Armatimonadota bacterium]HQK95468.1 putative zinc-binding protein [Armatimonadota bacterium]